MSRWLDVHVFTGIAGSLLVLFHSAFQLRTPIATVTSVSLAVVVVTGLAGRYLYAVVLRPGATSLGQRLAEMRATLPDFAKAVQEALLACPTSRLPPNASLLRTLATIPKWALQARARRGVVKRVAADHPELMELRETEPRAVTRFVREISWEAGRDVDRSMGEAMLRSWRGVHRLMALLFVFSVVVHVGVALKFGYWWVFSLSEGAVP
jgi:hypothetical protein